ncbi:hypothetical protein EBR77_04645, partial [bacterium]|nr:hypothetical protein [bacterium]
VGVGNVKLGDVLQEVMRSAFEKIGQVFNTIGSVFNSVATVVGALGDVFSGDYGKQAAALNMIDKISPGTSSMLRQVLTITDAFKELKINDGDDTLTMLAKISSATLKGVTSKSTRYSRERTSKFEAGQLEEQAKAEMDPEKKADLLKRSQQRRLESITEQTNKAYSDYIKSTREYGKLKDEAEKFFEKKLTEEEIKEFAKGTLAYEKVISDMEMQQKAFFNAQSAQFNASKKLSEQQNKINETAAKKRTFTLAGAPTLSNNDTVDTSALYRDNNVDITATPESVTPNAIPAGKSLDDALKGLPLDELSYLKFLPTQAQLLKDQNNILMQLLQVNKDQPASVFANINQGGPTVIGGGGARSLGGRGAF